ncbi:hypothetical protein D3C84_841890 [compost metagenome]
MEQTVYIGLGVDYRHAVWNECIGPLVSVALLHEDFRASVEAVQIRTACQHLHWVVWLKATDAEADVLTQFALRNTEHIETLQLFELNLVRVCTEWFFRYPVRSLVVLDKTDTREP